MRTNYRQTLSTFLLCGILYCCHGLKFLASKPSPTIKRLTLGADLVIDCTTDKSSVQTTVHFSTSSPQKWRLLDSSEYSKQGNIYTLHYSMKYAGYFRCEARRIKGSMLYWPDQAGLLVVPDTRPVLTVTPNYEQVILSGESASFTCSTTLLSAILEWWQVDEKGKEHAVVGTVEKTIGDRKDLIMAITNAQESQSGFYKCVMRYYDGQRHKMASLKVFGKRPPTIVRHSGSKGDVVVTSKQATLECTADGYPRPSIKWYKDNKEITFPGCKTAVDLPSCQQAHEYSIKTSSLTSTVVKSQLVINKFEGNNPTLFSCRASNTFGHTNADISVILDMFRFLQSPPRSLAIKLMDFDTELSFDCTTNDRTARTFLLYSSTAKPWRNITKTKPGNSAKKVFTVTKKFTVQNSGFYKCVAVNSTGYTIEWPNPRGMIVIPSTASRRLPKPKVYPIYQQMVSTGDNINFTCSFSEGNLKWYRETQRNKFKVVPGSMVYKSKRKGLNGRSTAVLMLKNAQPSDSGLYKCVLKVHQQESFELASVKVFGSTPPTITSYSGQSGPIPINLGVRLECVVNYNPKSRSKLTITWLKEGKEITIPGCAVARDLYRCHNTKYRISLLSITSSSVRSLLKIKHFDKNVDAGVYTCKATYADGSYGATTANMKVGI